MTKTIKMISCMKALVGIASIAVTLPVLAIENPASEEAPKQKKGEGATAVDAEPKDNKVEKKIALLGLGGIPASETLSHHLDLGEGNGLTVYHIIPDSAAAKAGLKKHDVITELDDQKIGSQQDLRDVILAHEPGDEVVVKYIHKGEAMEKKVTLGERAEFQRMAGPRINPRWLRGNMPEAERKLMQGQMKKHMERMKLQLENGGIELDLQGLLNNAQKAVPQGDNVNGIARKMKLNFGGASMTMMDGEGSVTMKTVNGNKDVTVKDKDGKLLFEGPYQTDQDKAAVPDDIRERLERMNFSAVAGGGFRLRVGPGGVMPAPVEPEEDEDDDAE